MALHRIVCTLLALPLLVAPLAAQAGPAPHYSITLLNPPPGNSSANVYDLNDAGQVVGEAVQPGKRFFISAYLFSGGNATDIGAAFPDSSRATAINRSGQIAGYLSVDYPGWSSRAFLYSGAHLTDLGTLGGLGSRASGINDAGQIVGESTVGKTGPFHAFLYSNGRMQDLGTLGGTYSGAKRINNAGQVVGYAGTGTSTHAFLYSFGVMVDLGRLVTTDDNSWANDINAAGDVVGGSGSTVNARAFLYFGGVMIDLGAMLPGLGSEANGINDRGQVVGDAVDWGWPGSVRAFLYSDGEMRYLNSLVDPASGWLIEKAYAINNNGQILALGYNKNFGVQPMRLDPVAAVP